MEEESRFLTDRAGEMGIAMEMLKKKELPLRVTHNDTKLNNIMIDDETGKAVCVIDLDTIMPGLSIFDFGDALRFGANTGAEDEDVYKRQMYGKNHGQAGFSLIGRKERQRKKHFGRAS